MLQTASGSEAFCSELMVIQIQYLRTSTDYFRFELNNNIAIIPSAVILPSFMPSTQRSSNCSIPSDKWVMLNMPLPWSGEWPRSPRGIYLAMLHDFAAMHERH